MNAPLHTTEPVWSEEDGARAEHYALLARLFFAPPDPELLQALTRLGTDMGADPGMLGSAWRQLGECAAQTTAEAVEEEYTHLFLGVGRPEVMLYGSFYLSGFLMEEPLVHLRDDLAELGLGRRQGVVESEDHIAALCEVMRHLILTGPDAAGLARQQQFFERHLTWVAGLSDALAQTPGSVFYARVGDLARAFFEIERVAFDML